MKKILLIVCLSLFSYANNEYDNNLKSFNSNVYDNNFSLYLKEAYKDENWLNGNLKLKEKKEVLIKKEKFSIPEWKLALNEFKKSANTNILAAYQGANLIESGLMSFLTTNKDVKKYIKENLMIFTQPLIDKDYCYGYVLGTKYHLRYSKDYKKGFELATKGLESCKKSMDKSISLKHLEKENRLNYAKLYQLNKKDEK